MEQYKHLKQKEFFCGPTCLQIILFSEGDWVSQARLAKTINVKVDEDKADAYGDEIDTALPGKGGVPIDTFTDPDVKDGLDDYNLRASVHRMPGQDELRDTIDQVSNDGEHVIVNVHLQPLLGESFAHYLLVESVEDDALVLRDPHFATRDVWSASFEEVEYAMQPHWDDQSRGLIVVKHHGR